MRRAILIAAAALGLVACATAPTVPASTGAPIEQAAPPIAGPSAEAIVRADAALDRAWSAYVVIRRVAGLVVPFLSPTRAANVLSIEATVETAFARARAATDLTEKAGTLRDAVAAAGRLEALTVDPD